MPIYEYKCRECGDHFDVGTRADWLFCHNGHRAIRVWSLRIEAETARHAGRWDPVVGAYVESERQFRSLLREGQDAQSAKLGMECKLETVDARDQEGLAELHGQSLAEREHTAEQTKRAKQDARVTK